MLPPRCQDLASKLGISAKVTMKRWNNTDKWGCWYGHTMSRINWYSCTIEYLQPDARCLPQRSCCVGKQSYCCIAQHIRARGQVTMQKKDRRFGVKFIDLCTWKRSYSRRQKRNLLSSTGRGRARVCECGIRFSSWGLSHRRAQEKEWLDYPVADGKWPIY